MAGCDEMIVCLSCDTWNAPHDGWEGGMEARKMLTWGDDWP